jgi:hypothetical protein
MSKKNFITKPTEVREEAKWEGQGCQGEEIVKGLGQLKVKSKWVNHCPYSHSSHSEEKSKVQGKASTQ